MEKHLKMPDTIGIDMAEGFEIRVNGGEWATSVTVSKGDNLEYRETREEWLDRIESALLSDALKRAPQPFEGWGGD